MNPGYFLACGVAIGVLVVLITIRLWRMKPAPSHPCPNCNRHPVFAQCCGSTVRLMCKCGKSVVIL